MMPGVLPPRPAVQPPQLEAAQAPQLGVQAPQAPQAPQPGAQAPQAPPPGAQPPPSREEGKSVLHANPTFDRVFRAQKWRKPFLATKKRAAKAHPTLDDMLMMLKKRLRKLNRCCLNRRGSTQCVFQSLRGDEDFLKTVSEWRKNWKLTPAAMKRAALLQHVQQMQVVSRHNTAKPMPSMPSLLSDISQRGEGEVCSLEGRPSLVLPHESTKLTYSFLGKRFCRKSFAALTGVNPFRMTKRMKDGELTAPQHQRLRSQARCRVEMIKGIWMVVSDLHRQSPFAKHAQQPSVWHIPFHQ